MAKERHPNNLGLADQYAEKLMKFIIGEEMKIKSINSSFFIVWL